LQKFDDGQNLCYIKIQFVMPNFLKFILAGLIQDLIRFLIFEIPKIALLMFLANILGNEN
jgi:hypothetical protein